MNSKERVKLSLLHREPDMVPVFELMINQPVAEAIMGREMLVGIGAGMIGPLLFDHVSRREARAFMEKGFKDHVALYEELDLDAIVMPGVVSGLLFEAPHVIRLDDYTYRFDGRDGESWWVVRVDPVTDTWGEVDHHLLHEGLAGLLRLVEKIENSEAYQPKTEQVEFLNQAFAGSRNRFLIGNADVIMPNHTAWFPMFLEAMILAPELVERYIRATTIIMKGWVDLFGRAGFDGIVGGTDFAGVNGPFFSPAMFERFYAVPLRSLVDHVHSRGMAFIKHSDGNVEKILAPLFLDSGADAFHAIEPAAGMDIYSLKERIGDRVSLWGNVDCGKLLCTGSEDEVRSEVRRLIGLCGPGGGYLLSSSNSIHGGVRPENFLAMLDETRKTGRYGAEVGA